MRAELAAQRFVQQMGGAMVRADALPALVVHVCNDRCADTRFTGFDHACMDEEAEFFLRVLDAEFERFAADDITLIADLAAALRVKRCLVEDQRSFGAGCCGFDGLPAGDDGQDFGFGRFRGIAEKFGGAERVAQFEPDAFGSGVAGAAPGGARAFALFRHGGVETVHVNRAVPLAQRILGEVERKSVGIVKAERNFPWQRFTFAEACDLFAEQSEAAFQHGAETGLFELQGFGSETFGAAEFGIGSAHLTHQSWHEFVEHCVARTHHVQVAHGAPHDTAKHVAAAFIGWQHTIGNEKAAAAQMVGNDAVADARWPVRRLAGGVRARGNQGAEYVGVVVVVGTLQNGGNALQAHACIDGRARQRRARAWRAFLELHEYQVPDFDEPVTIFVGAAWRSAWNVRAVVVEDFRAGAAGAGVAHTPEIVCSRNANDALFRQARDPVPERGCVVVFGEDGDEEFFRAAGRSRV